MAGVSGLEPGLVQAGRGAGPPLRLALQQQAHEVAGGLAHALEVVLREAEVQAADVQARLLQALVQEGGRAAQHHVGHHPCRANNQVGQSL